MILLRDSIFFGEQYVCARFGGEELSTLGNIIYNVRLCTVLPVVGVVDLRTL